MSEKSGSDLARRLFESSGVMPWDMLNEIEKAIWQGVAAEALAYVKEKLGRERVAEAIWRATSDCADDWTWEVEKKLYGDDYYRQAAAILALLDAPTPDPERREG